MTETVRSSFALNGPSITLDPQTEAVRGDLADIALAGKIFVPHYAKPMEMRCHASNSAVRIAADAAAEVVTVLEQGQSFMAVDLAGDWAWGFTADQHLVGYVPLSALEQVA